MTLKHISSISLAGCLYLLLTGCQIEPLPKNTDSSSSASDSAPSDTPSTRPGQTHDIMVYWQAPTIRVNGTAMPQEQIAGYELRFRNELTTAYQSIILSPTTTQYLLEDQPTSDQLSIEVAVFDQEGVYSSFIPAAIN